MSQDLPDGPKGCNASVSPRNGYPAHARQRYDCPAPSVHSHPRSH